MDLRNRLVKGVVIGSTIALLALPISCRHSEVKGRNTLKTDPVEQVEQKKSWGYTTSEIFRKALIITTDIIFMGGIGLMTKGLSGYKRVEEENTAELFCPECGKQDITDKEIYPYDETQLRYRR